MSPEPLISAKDAHKTLAVGARLRLWFACLLIVLLPFSVALGGSSGFAVVLWVTSAFAVPVSCLYLPLVVKLRDAEQSRWIVLLSVGAVIGPAALACLGLIQVWKGRDPQLIWLGDGEDPGFRGLALCALVVGTLTSLAYVIGLKLAARRPSDDRST